MMKQSAVFAVAALFIISGGIVSAQAPTRDFPAAANPTAAPPAANNPSTGTPDRPPGGDHAGGQRARPGDHWSGAS
jgi:hypothetical protein